MSHELRTPLNSLLILAKLLADNRTTNLYAEAGRVRQDHLRLRRRSAGAHQRDPRSVQGRGRQDAGRVPRGAASARCRTSSSAASGTSPSRRGWSSRSTLASESTAAPSTPIRNGCSRSSRTCSPTPSSSPQWAASPCRSRRAATDEIEFQNRTLSSADRVMASP